MERVLNSRPPSEPPAGDIRPGGAARRRQRQPGVVPQAGRLPAARTRPVRSAHRPVCRVARPLGVQLPRRRQHPGGARRGGRPAGSARDRAHRPRRAVRGGALRRGGRGTRTCAPCSAPNCPSARCPAPHMPDPPGPHLLVLARGPEGYRRLSRQLAAAHLAGGQKGMPRYDYDALTEAAGGHWHILTGCRKGHVRQALSTGGPRAAAAALADLVDRFGPDRVSVELTHHGHPRRRRAQRRAGRAGAAVRGRRWSPPPPRTSPSRPGPGWRRRWRRSGPGSPWTPRPAGWRRWAARICARVRRWPGCSPGARGGHRGRRSR